MSARYFSIKPPICCPPSRRLFFLNNSETSVTENFVFAAAFHFRRNCAKFNRFARIKFMPDIELRCVECRNIFLFTEKEQQEFYRTNKPQPQRCATCRPSKRKLAQAAGTNGIKKRYDIVCDRCGKQDFVLFAPKPGRNILCQSCHAASQSRTRFA
jgi:CxxC-x17-CxxC domain-containing protein